MTMPKRIYADLCISPIGVSVLSGTFRLEPDEIAATQPYILATPEALAASPEVAELIAEARREGESLAETIWLTAIETVDDALREMGKHADPRLTAIDALKRRAMKEPAHD